MEEDNQDKKTRLVEMRTQTDQEMEVIALLQQNNAALMEEVKEVGDPGYYQYLLKEQESEVQRIRMEVEERSCEKLKLEAQLRDARVLANQTYHQLKCVDKLQ